MKKAANRLLGIFSLLVFWFIHKRHLIAKVHPDARFSRVQLMHTKFSLSVVCMSPNTQLITGNSFDYPIPVRPMIKTFSRNFFFLTNSLEQNLRWKTQSSWYLLISTIFFQHKILEHFQNYNHNFLLAISLVENHQSYFFSWWKSNLS